MLDNHVKITEQLASDVAAGRAPEPDIVIWPENSSDIDPLLNPDAAAQIDRAARAVGVPILVGTVLRNPDGQTTTNSALVWEAGVGVVERSDKRRIQPFGEYMPWRDFFRLFSPYVDRAGYFVPGAGAGRVDMAGVRVGVAICWEVAFDDLRRRQRRRRRAGARGPQQQRHLRAHRDDVPADGDVADPLGRARPHGRSSRPRAG